MPEFISSYEEKKTFMFCQSGLVNICINRHRGLNVTVKDKVHPLVVYSSEQMFSLPNCCFT